MLSSFMNNELVRTWKEMAVT